MRWEYFGSECPLNWSWAPTIKFIAMPRDKEKAKKPKKSFSATSISSLDSITKKSAFFLQKDTSSMRKVSEFHCHCSKSITMIFFVRTQWENKNSNRYWLCSTVKISWKSSLSNQQLHLRNSKRSWRAQLWAILDSPIPSFTFCSNFKQRTINSWISFQNGMLIR